MEFITLPVIYTKMKNPSSLSAQDQSYRSVLEELGEEVEEDEVEFNEMFEDMHIDTRALRDVVISPYINEDGSITANRAVLEFGKLSGNRRVVIEVNTSVEALLEKLSKI